MGSWYVFFLFQINGKLTLGENIADNGGFKASHRVGAFKSKKFIFTGLPVAQPSYKMGTVFPSGTNHTVY